MKRRELIASGAALAASGMFGLRARAQTKMKLGLISYNVAKGWDLPTVLKNCAAAGIAGFEARTTHAHGIEPSLSAEKRQAVKRQFADAGLVLWGLGSVCEFHAESPATVTKNIEECKRFVELAADLGAKGVKVRPNGLRKDVPPEATLKQIGEALRTCGEFGAAHSVEIWLEVHGPQTQIPSNIRQIMDFCNHANVGACWNSNPTDVENGSVQASFDLLKKDIKSCHINDLWGKYPYRELFSLFNAAGYDRFTMCEYATSIPADKGIEFLKRYREKWEELQRPT